VGENEKGGNVGRNTKKPLFGRDRGRITKKDKRKKRMKKSRAKQKLTWKKTHRQKNTRYRRGREGLSLISMKYGGKKRGLGKGNERKVETDLVCEYE